MKERHRISNINLKIQDSKDRIGAGIDIAGIKLCLSFQMFRKMPSRIPDLDGNHLKGEASKRTVSKITNRSRSRHSAFTASDSFRTGKHMYQKIPIAVERLTGWNAGETLDDKPILW